MNFDMPRWQARFDELRAAHHVPGATLAILVDGRVHALATGVLHRGTGVATTPDSIFQSGSIAKVYTATLVMQLAEAGLVDLDAPIVDVLPEFGTADPSATKIITTRQLLSHTGGLTCDFTFDGGRGDECLARYVAAAREVALDCQPGEAISYSSVGYNVLGRLVEVLTGLTWDEALKQKLVDPLGVEHTMTLPEEALRFRVAMGHLGEPGREPDPAPAWDMMPRSAGPYGRVLVTAGDLVRFARLHLEGGLAADGARILSADTVASMQRRVIDTPDKWTVSSDGWGLGWTLYDWDGVSGYGHDGASLGQYSYLRIVPSAGVAVALMTNGGGARELYAELFRELLAELAAVRMPASFAPAAEPTTVDMTPYLGKYVREGVAITITADPVPHLRYEFTGGMKDFSPPLEAELVSVSDRVFAAAGQGPFAEAWMPVVFDRLPDGTVCCYIGMRCAPRVAE